MPPLPAPRPSLLRSPVPVTLVGGIASGGAMFLLSVLVARALPPSGFADFVFCLALSQLWLIPTIAGLELAGPRHLAGAETRERSAAAGSVIALSAGLGGAAVLVSLPFAGALAAVTGSSGVLVLLAMWIGVVTGLRAVLERLLASLGLLPSVARIKVVEAALLVGGALAVMLRAEQIDWLLPAGVVAVAAGVAVAAYVTRLHRATGTLRVARAHVVAIGAFARHAAPTTVFAVLLMYLDKFALRLGASDVTYALYSAYFAGSLVVGVQAVFVLQSVIVPASVRSGSSAAVLLRIRRVAPWLLVLSPLGYLATLLVVLALLGPEYPFEVRFAVPFALWAALYTCNTLCMTAVVARSTAAMTRESRVLALRVLVALALLATLVALDRLSLLSVVLVMLLVEALELINVVTMATKYLGPGRGTPGLPTHDP